MCVVLHSEGDDGREMALPDRDCAGQERPGEREPCPNLPLCASPTTSSPVATSRFPYTSTSLPEDSLIVDHGTGYEDEFEVINSNSSSVMLDTDDSLQDDEILLNSITTERTYENVVQFVRNNENSTANTVYDSGKRDERVTLGGWTVTPWGPCSVTCGSGVRTRGAVCLKQGNTCNPNIKPSVSEYCYSQENCGYPLGHGEFLDVNI
jgi:hypothetical protein